MNPMNIVEVRIRQATKPAYMYMLEQLTTFVNFLILGEFSHPSKLNWKIFREEAS